MSINSKIFNKDYYYNTCLGSDEFKQSGGRKLHPKVKTMIDQLNLNKNMNVLEIGCGRGDTTLYIARKVRTITGIDYSEDAIKIANELRKRQKTQIQNKTTFYKMNATKLSFKDNSFDFVVFIDTIDHLNKREQEQTLKEIRRVMKNTGEIFIRTCSNKLLLSYTYRFYTYPLNNVLTWIDKKMKKVEYESLPKTPRTKEQKQQHINEPNYFMLKNLFGKYFQNISIKAEPGFIKEGNGIRTSLYNFLIALHPFSQYYPLNILFGHSFLCNLKKPLKPKNAS